MTDWLLRQTESYETMRSGEFVRLKKCVPAQTTCRHAVTLLP
jgi:hypothetical protein